MIKKKKKNVFYESHDCILSFSNIEFYKYQTENPEISSWRSLTEFFKKYIWFSGGMVIFNKHFFHGHLWMVKTDC